MLLVNVGRNFNESEQVTFVLSLVKLFVFITDALSKSTEITFPSNIFTNLSHNNVDFVPCALQPVSTKV